MLKKLQIWWLWLHFKGWTIDIILYYAKDLHTCYGFRGCWDNEKQITEKLPLSIRARFYGWVSDSRRVDVFWNSQLVCSFLVTEWWDVEVIERHLALDWLQCYRDLAVSANEAVRKEHKDRFASL